MSVEPLIAYSHQTWGQIQASVFEIQIQILSKSQIQIQIQILLLTSVFEIQIQNTLSSI